MQIFTPAFDQRVFSVDATSSYCLPLQYCPECKRESGASGAGFNLPWADPKALPLSKSELGKIAFWKKPGKGKLSLEQYNQVRSTLRSAAPIRMPIPFGISFGPIIGKVIERVEGVVVTHTDGISATVSHLNQIARAGITIESCPTNLEFYKKVPVEEIRELWAPPLARFANQDRIEWCEFCESGKYREREFQGLEREELELDAQSIPANAHIFRVWETPAVLCVTKYFIDVLTSLGLNQVDWVPVAVK